MSNGDGGLEFLRFGSSIPGNYWGCCACCIIQNLKVDPDAKASIQLVSGDSGTPIMDHRQKPLFAGPTYRDIFWQRLRVGTFSTQEMPNHAFIAIMEESQIATVYGKAWLGILKEAGFEFVRKVNNSVWNKPNYIFMLVRNVGPNAYMDQFKPPKAWTDLPSVVPEAWEFVADDDAGRKSLTAAIVKAQKPLYDKLPVNKWMTEDELKAMGAPVILAGLRSEYHRPGTKENREAIKAKESGVKAPTTSLKGAAPPPICGCGDPNCLLNQVAV